MATEPQTTRVKSPELMGPSTICSRTRGIDSARRLATSALTAPRMRRGSTGLANGSRRDSAARVDFGGAGDG